MNVAILGASNKPDRYSHKAQVQLLAAGHTVFPINPALGEILGTECYVSVEAIDQSIHTLAVYVNPSRLEPLIESVIALGPERIILNPGTESESAKSELEAAGIDVLEACTLVMIATGAF